MKLLSAIEVEALIEGGGADDFIFSYTSILLHDGEKFYKARSSQRTTILKRIDTSRLEIKSTPIPVGDYRPLFSDELMTAPNLMSQDCWEKLPDLSCYDSRDPTRLEEFMLREARIVEMLMGHPHPNVARYHGCVVREGHIASLCFTRYHQTLVERIYHDTRPFDPHVCLQEIKKGIQHLHSIGIIHNDINPSSVMLCTDDTAVIIDFNSCRKKGEEGWMEGTYRWTDASYNNNCAEFENDKCGLRKIREWLRDPAPFHWNGVEDRTRHKQQAHHGQFGKDCFICG
ncbi:MAG: hypothetical protein ALECFALPRED_009821 [Alectoria fallacina]|uniref:Protein kinase domain-containing protein n=1 Tax=Alectoria fallacina TaxID=1903189 RepID=A0A8H3PJ21_9LECA|nr:MAG: hypothetical protein ALECFALPRED_009821 [Alectoria fallacina]